MQGLTRNHKIVLQCVLRMGGGRLSYGKLAIMTGYHRNTIRNAVHELSACGLLCVEKCGRGRPNLYRIPDK